MKLVNTNDEKFFDPTPRLKSSPIPIKFISFNRFNTICIYCGEKYIETLLCHDQKYCKKCLSRYINDITDNNIYLDIHYTMELECNEHEISKTKVPQSIQEFCKNCIRILCFKHTKGSFSNEYPTNNNYTNILYNNYTIELECNEHEIRKVPQSIQECCRNCIRILCFKQIIGFFNKYPTNNNYTNILYNKVIKDEKHCQLSYVESH
ncbi:hypothetical protein RirG_118780 [Rhizophagus irregularis DAOM 197198w]|uniref:Uncharacterized protein n=1 Tax=Rhizophagus irregularis (strain DAOM 197198w) TaxID=1432141 RepID=A0A015L3E7_RHIIW|nr:hypothetical protein RirG_118780 [Rhizophagus irregularis DAOM 197198w]